MCITDAVVTQDEKTRQATKRHQTSSTRSQRNRINGMSTSMRWESGQAFLALYSFFQKPSLQAVASFNERLAVSSNSWEMKGACALEKPISSKACACCSSGEGDVIAEMSPVCGGLQWEVGATQSHRRHTRNCVDRDSKNESTSK